MTLRTHAEVRTARIAAVLGWGLPNLRALPWRQTRDPWAILVSEVMLQQTQAERVVPKWHAFLERFPDPTTCGVAPLGDVLRLWQGLGYPRRARNLHQAARAIADTLETTGRFPDDLPSLLALPGVGPYTARAVLAFAFESDAAVVDTNIARVYARLAGQKLTAREVQRLADSHLPPGRSWEWNQALMDLGATLCRPTPECFECPLKPTCRWAGSNGDTDPAIGTAGVSARQARFEGSDRQARGRLLKALTAASISRPAAAEIMGRDAQTAERLIASLVADGLCHATPDQLSLPT